MSTDQDKSIRRIINSRVLGSNMDIKDNSNPSLEAEHTAAAAASAALFADVQLAPPDPILGLNQAFNADTDPRKLNLGVGAYRTEEGKPLVLNVVRKVEHMIVNDAKLNKEYLPIEGLKEFNALTARLILGDSSPALAQQRVATVQSLSGTGALRIGAAFIQRFLPGVTVYVSDPTWANHFNIFRDAGVPTKTYRYFDEKTNSLFLSGMLDDIRAAPQGSVILLHACAHNPTGVDPNPAQWRQIAEVVIQRRHIVFFDCAYQGFASGDLDADAAAVRYFVNEANLQCLIAQSYAKNFGLYGERIGALSVVCANKTIADNVLSQLKALIRPMYSSPPSHGARMVAATLADRALFDEWRAELKMMADRIKSMRQLLFDALRERRTPGNWEHILNQIGMFSFSGLNKAQSERMINTHHIYMLTNGRISMAGLSARAVPYLADAIHEVLTAIPN